MKFVDKENLKDNLVEFNTKVLSPKYTNKIEKITLDGSELTATNKTVAINLSDTYVTASDLSESIEDLIDDKMTPYANKIESVKLNDTALTIADDKSVNIDLSGYAKTDSLSNYENKIEKVSVNGTEAAITDKAVNIDLSDYVTSSDVDDKLADYAKSSDFYSKEEIDGELTFATGSKVSTAVGNLAADTDIGGKTLMYVMKLMLLGKASADVPTPAIGTGTLSSDKTTVTFTTTNSTLDGVTTTFDSTKVTGTKVASSTFESGNIVVTLTDGIAETSAETFTITVGAGALTNTATSDGLYKEGSAASAEKSQSVTATRQTVSAPTLAASVSGKVVTITATASSTDSEVTNDLTIGSSEITVTGPSGNYTDYTFASKTGTSTQNIYTVTIPSTAAEGNYVVTVSKSAVGATVTTAGTYYKGTVNPSSDATATVTIAAKSTATAPTVAITTSGKVATIKVTAKTTGTGVTNDTTIEASDVTVTGATTGSYTAGTFAGSNGTYTYTLADDAAADTYTVAVAAGAASVTVSGSTTYKDGTINSAAASATITVEDEDSKTYTVEKSYDPTGDESSSINQGLLVAPSGLTSDTESEYTLVFTGTEVTPANIEIPCADLDDGAASTADPNYPSFDGSYWYLDETTVVVENGEGGSPFASLVGSFGLEFRKNKA